MGEPASTLQGCRHGAHTIRVRRDPDHGLRSSAYQIPTDAPESDGTYRLGPDDAGRRRGDGGGNDGPRLLLRRHGGRDSDPTTCLPSVVRGRDAMAVPGAWSAMVAAIRNLGRPGIASMAISAVDAALWDLKARLLDLPLVTLLGAARDASGPCTAAAASRLIPSSSSASSSAAGSPRASRGSR